MRFYCKEILPLCLCNEQKGTTTNLIYEAVRPQIRYYRHENETARENSLVSNSHRFGSNSGRAESWRSPVRRRDPGSAVQVVMDVGSAETSSAGIKFRLGEFPLVSTAAAAVTKSLARCAPHCTAITRSAARLSSESDQAAALRLIRAPGCGHHDGQLDLNLSILSSGPCRASLS